MYSQAEVRLHKVLSLFIFLGNKLLHFFIRLLPSQWVSYTQPNWPVQADLTNQIVVITGSNTGIGKASAMQLASFGATVVLACRDVERGQEAERDINAALSKMSLKEYPEAGKGKAVFMQLDLSDLHSVWNFRRIFQSNFDRLDILINNAGQNTNEVLPNGLKKLFQVNYLGHYLLFRCLEDLLTDPRNPTTARVINLSSVAHHSGHPNFKLSALSSVHSGILIPTSPYGDSKFYMNLLTMEINRRYNAPMAAAATTATAESAYLHELTAMRERRGVQTRHQATKANVSATPVVIARRSILSLAANPGGVTSDIWRHVPFQWLFKAAISLLFLNVVEGSATTVFAAVVDEQVVQDYRNSIKENGRGRLCLHRDVPYIIPYSMPIRLLALECIGPFAGPRFSFHSLPNSSNVDNDPFSSSITTAFSVEYQSPEDLAQQLWTYSAELCRKILHLSGVKDSELAFL